MTLRVVCLTLGIVALTDGSLPAQPRRGDQPAGAYGWIFDLEEGKALARSSGRPLMVVVRCVP
jgi:hypothetical protein